MLLGVYTPTVLQLETVECGAAALGIILAYFGRHVPLTELRERCGVSRDGSKASKIVQAARSYSLQAKGYSKTLEQLKELPFPFIVFWQFNHFVVVEKITRNIVYLNDPASGHRIITRQEFSDGYTGVVLSMKPGPDFRKGGRKPRLLSVVASRLRGYWGTVAFCLLAGVLLTLPGLAGAVFIRVFIDHLLLEGHTSWLRPLLAIMVLTLLLQFGLKFLETTFRRRLMLTLTAQFTSRFFWHLLHLPMTFYTQRYVGEVGYRMQLNQKVAALLTGRLAAAILALVSMAIYGAVMLCFSTSLTLIGASFVGLNFVALRWFAARRLEASLRMTQETGKAAAVGMAGLQGIETLKASAMETGFFAKWAGYYSKGAQAQQDLERITVNLGVLPGLLQGLAITAVLVVGGYKVMAGELSVGMLVAFQTLMQLFLDPVSELVLLSGTAQELHADLLRLDDVEGYTKRQPGDVPGPNDESEQQASNFEIEVKNLTFGYSAFDPPLIANFHLQIPAGQWVALVGDSGSGKSTLARLLTGLYEPWSGVVRFAAQTRQRMRPDVVRQQLGFVDQEVFLFEGTIRENLTLWDHTIPEEVIRRACQDAALEKVIDALPGGLDTVLLEGGGNLSGGERQRLEIARALVNNPTILVLDEATSALDVETEQVVIQNLRRRGCTCLLIAHRLSTIRTCEEILVLRQGEVVERGTHEQLWAARGHYAHLLQTEES